MTQEEFEKKWFQQWVKPRGIHYKIPQKNYIVTAALYKGGAEEESIFAIISEDYKPGANPEWFTLHVNEEDLVKLDEDFEII